MQKSSKRYEKLLGTLIISFFPDFVDLSDDATWIHDMNIPRSKFRRDSGIFNATTTVYGTPAINTGEVLSGFGPFVILNIIV